ncbi:MAG: helix-hairpin-helix domain-containing protein, partial [bacterium]|nr:helix-hairpin-helix domain-containing protein [bacterium]
KMALAISEAGSDQIVNAIHQANVSFFTSFPRVGKKVAQKLIIELKTKLGGKKDLDLAPKSPVYQDTYEALLALGLPAEQVETVLSTLDLEQLTPAAAVKQVLRSLKK